MTEHGGHIHYERGTLGGAAFVLDLPVVSVEAPTISSTQIQAAPAVHSGPAARAFGEDFGGG